MTVWKGILIEIPFYFRGSLPACGQSIACYENDTEMIRDNLISNPFMNYYVLVKVSTITFEKSYFYM